MLVLFGASFDEPGLDSVGAVRSVVAADHRDEGRVEPIRVAGFGDHQAQKSVDRLHRSFEG
jgi:hypothetical protein